ncbi:hypothetical protein CSUI_003257 [Cystoisospora suis]|uniref:Uncharacterized protein n=1 Tax=Cystoisospora suis TaxID=483139 RepID=A0A2C6KFT1_9APIC|nr:hypothetical protein CSUI_003257 [Cystoisospora suis]
MACHVHVYGRRGGGALGASKSTGSSSSLLASLAQVFKWGKRWRVHKQTLLIQTYEKPCIKRTRIAEEKAYYPRWFYLKYATEVLKFSLKNHLRLDSAYNRDRLLFDEQRLDADPRGGGGAFGGGEDSLYPRYAVKSEREKLLKELEDELLDIHKKILRMDYFDVVTQTPKNPLSRSSLHIAASDILREVEENIGRIPPWRVFYQRYGGRRTATRRGRQARPASLHTEEEEADQSSSLSSSSYHPGKKDEEEHVERSLNRKEEEERPHAIDQDTKRSSWSFEELRVLYFYLLKFVSLSIRLKELRDISLFDESSHALSSSSPEKTERRISWGGGYNESTLSKLFDRHRSHFS